MDATQALRGSRVAVLAPSREKLELVGAWFEAEYPSLLRFAYFVTADRAAAEDLVHDAFERIWRSAGGVRTSTIRALARTTVLNLARSRFRRRAREGRSASAIDRAAVAPGPEPSMHDEVWRAIKRLTPNQRACIALRYYEDLSEQEVAKALGMRPGTVKSHTHRAMSRLRDLLGSNEPVRERTSS